MMNWVVKLQRHGGQFRVTLPKELILKAGLEDVEVMSLKLVIPGIITLGEYFGKGKEKRGIQENRS